MINKKGEVTVRLNDEDGGKKDISLCDLLEGLKERGTTRTGLRQSGCSGDPTEFYPGV